jgi:hypothetical protein
VQTSQQGNCQGGKQQKRSDREALTSVHDSPPNDDYAMIQFDVWSDRRRTTVILIRITLLNQITSVGGRAYRLGLPQLKNASGEKVSVINSIGSSSPLAAKVTPIDY